MFALEMISTLLLARSLSVSSLPYATSLHATSYLLGFACNVASFCHPAPPPLQALLFLSVLIRLFSVFRQHISLHPPASFSENGRFQFQSRAKVKEAMGFALDHADASADVVGVLKESLLVPETPIHGKANWRLGEGDVKRAMDMMKVQRTE